MTNAEQFKKTFGIYAEEFWSYTGKQMLDWINTDVPDINVGDMISRQAAIDALERDIKFVEEEREKAITRPEKYHDRFVEASTQQIMGMAHALQAIEELPSAQPERLTDYSFEESCTECPAYDTENHRCPRFNQVIRTALKDANLEPCEDCISRQAAIDAICKACSMEGDYHKCDGYPETSTWCDELVALRALPSVQPENARKNARKRMRAIVSKGRRLSIWIGLQNYIAEIKA